MLGRIVKFRRGNQYEEMEGNDVAGKTTADSDKSRVQTNATPDSSGVPPDTTPDDVLTVDRAVEMIGFGWFQMKLSLFTGLVWMADAMEMMILSILGPALHCDWLVPPWQQALLTTIVFGGMMLSSGFWGKVCDKYGRKTELLLCSMFTFYFGLLSAFSPNYIWMLVLRGLVGFGIGGVPQSITLYAEFLPSSTRASCVILVEIFWAVGTCLVVFLSIFIMPTIGWRYLLAIASLPLVIFFSACFWLPESPRFDIARGMPDRAMATLERVARENGKPMPLGKLVDVVAEVMGQSSLALCTSCLAVAANELLLLLLLAEGPVKRGQVMDLLVPDLRRTTILLWFIWLTNAFAYYGIVLVTTELFQVDDVCHGGRNAEIIAEPKCRMECKTLTTKDYTDLLWTTIAEFPGLFITILIIEYIGRRFTMAIEFFVFAFFVLLVNICVSRTALIAFLFVARAFISGGFQASYVYTPEVYPTTVRALGLGVCSGMARIGALVTPFVAQVLLRTSVHVAITLYSGIAILAGIMAILLPIETKGREMTDTHSQPSSRPPSRATEPAASTR